MPALRGRTCAFPFVARLPPPTNHRETSRVRVGCCAEAGRLVGNTPRRLDGTPRSPLPASHLSSGLLSSRFPSSTIAVLPTIRAHARSPQRGFLLLLPPSLLLSLTLSSFPPSSLSRFISLALCGLSRPFISRLDVLPYVVLSSCSAYLAWTCSPLTIAGSFFVSPSSDTFFLPWTPVSLFLSRRRHRRRRHPSAGAITLSALLLLLLLLLSSSSSFLPASRRLTTASFSSPAPPILFPPSLLSRNSPVLVTLLVPCSFPFSSLLPSFSPSPATLFPLRHPPLPPSWPLLPRHPRFLHARIHPRTTQKKQRWRSVSMFRES